LESPVLELEVVSWLSKWRCCSTMATCCLKQHLRGCGRFCKEVRYQYQLLSKI